MSETQSVAGLQALLGKINIKDPVVKSPVDEEGSVTLQPPTPIDNPSKPPPDRTAARPNMHTRNLSSDERSPPRSQTDWHFKETLNAFQGETSSGQRTINQYILKGRLGSGNYAVVELATDRESDVDYAVKEFSKSRLRRRAQSEALKGSRGILRGRGVRRTACQQQDNTEEGDLGPLNLSLIKTEVAIMKKVHHPHVAYIREVIDVTRDDSLLVVMELCKGGPIINVTMDRAAEPLPEDKVRFIFRQLVLGIAYLHHNSIIHRDIKPDNCLFMEDMQTVKIVDFGVSEIFIKDDDHHVKSAGSPAYMAPELLDKEAAHLDGFACDMWSLGITLYALATGHLPFSDANPLQLFEAIAKDPIPPARQISPPLQALFDKLLVRDPSRRSTIRDMWNDAWVTERGKDPLVSYDENCATPIEEPSEAEIEDALKTMRSSFLVAQVAGKFRKAGRRNSSSSDTSSSQHE